MKLFQKKQTEHEGMEQEIRLRLERQEQEFQKCIHEKLETIAFLMAENQALRMELRQLKQELGKGDN